MLKLKIMMNSGVADIFATKCCAVHDANLEIILTNVGRSSISVAGRFSLAGMQKNEPLNLYPQGVRTLAPGEAAAYYAAMDPDRWAGYSTLTVTDTDDHMQVFELHPATD